MAETAPMPGIEVRISKSPASLVSDLIKARQAPSMSAMSWAICCNRPLALVLQRAQSQRLLTVESGCLVLDQGLSGPAQLGEIVKGLTFGPRSLGLQKGGIACQVGGIETVCLGVLAKASAKRLTCQGLSLA